MKTLGFYDTAALFKLNDPIPVTNNISTSKCSNNKKIAMISAHFSTILLVWLIASHTVC